MHLCLRVVVVLNQCSLSTFFFFLLFLAGLTACDLDANFLDFLYLSASFACFMADFSRHLPALEAWPLASFRSWWFLRFES